MAFDYHDYVMTAMLSENCNASILAYFLSHSLICLCQEQVIFSNVEINKNQSFSLIFLLKWVIFSYDYVAINNNPFL